MRRWAVTAMMVGGALPGAALAGAPALVHQPAPPQHAPADLRVRPVQAPDDPRFRIDDPRSMLRSGYGGSMVDLFPFEGGKFHISGGGRLFGRAGRPHLADPECLRLLPSFRAGPRLSRRFSPAMLVGYGRTVERGLAFGVDVGMVMGKIVQSPDRLGRLNRQRVDAGVWRGKRERTNELMRVTALYRF